MDHFGHFKLLQSPQQSRIIYLINFIWVTMENGISISQPLQIPPPQAESSQNSNEKKNPGAPHRRILKDHDLDRLLVYEKRGLAQRRDFYTECVEKAEIDKRSKKQRKKDKMEAKILVNQFPQLHEQIKETKIEAKSDEIQSLKASDQTLKIPQPQNKKPATRQRPVYKYTNDSSAEVAEFRFPLVNGLYSEHSKQYIETMKMLDQKRQSRENPNKKDTYINCDVKYFNWQHFVEEVGKFDVMLIDPPWRIKGAQKNDTQFMFSNCRFSLEYNTMSIHEIKSLPLHVVTDQGFIFLWILNTQLNDSLEIMQHWGYELVEEIVWVKLRNQKIYLTHGFYFMHSYEICLVGYKNRRKDGKSMMVRHGINANTVFGQIEKKSQKPREIYQIIEMAFKDKKKLQVFARNHNLRFGIFSVGNELGESYDKWKLHLNCNDCDHEIKPKTKRYKSKVKANYDLCQKCIDKHNKQQFFEIANEATEDIRHQYFSCNMCKTEPIWGIMFQCLKCRDYDLCENCFDKYLDQKNEKKHEEHGEAHSEACQHEIRTLEVPVYGFGFPIHEHKCNSCYQNPIIGVCFSCTTCQNFKLCQKCFYERPWFNKINSFKSHKANHEFEAFIEPLFNEQKQYNCFNCDKVIVENCYMCENCYDFFFCEECYNQRHKFKSAYANRHKQYHVFTKMF